jgi:predicted N-acetyltransferase YhbS
LPLTTVFSLLPDTGKFDSQCEGLYAHAFGPGRYAKAAARLRENNLCHRDVSVLAFKAEKLVGACRLWPIGASNGAIALFLGPIAVDASVRSAGLGQSLVWACLQAVDLILPSPVILVGDLSFFSRFGFAVIPEGLITMPGPVDPNRLLWRVDGLTATLPAGLLSVPHATSSAS